MLVSVILLGVATTLLSICNIMHTKDIRELKLEQQRLQKQVQLLETELLQ